MIILASSSSFILLAGGPRALLVRGIATIGDDDGGCPAPVIPEPDDLVISEVELQRTTNVVELMFDEHKSKLVASSMVRRRVQIEHT
jgi:hypothetical protein